MKRLPSVTPLVLCAAATVLTGCSSSSGEQVARLETIVTTAAKAASKPNDDPELARLEFARCMREHGVDFPDPTTSAGGGQRFQRVRITADPKTFERAQKACRQLMPRNPNLENPERRAEIQDQLLRFARCMREHGVEMPDPQLSGGGGGFTFRVRPRNRAGLNPESKAFQQAQQACDEHLPNFGPGRGGPR